MKKLLNPKVVVAFQEKKSHFEVGKYDDEILLFSDLETYTSYKTGKRRGRWRSVFGKNNLDAPTPAGSKVGQDKIENCDNCPPNIKDHHRFEEIFGGSLVSPFQDEHYIYVVIPNGGTGEDFYPPVMYVVDMENSSKFNNLLVP